MRHQTIIRERQVLEMLLDGSVTGGSADEAVFDDLKWPGGLATAGRQAQRKPRR